MDDGRHFEAILKLGREVLAYSAALAIGLMTALTLAVVARLLQGSPNVRMGWVSAWMIIAYPALVVPLALPVTMLRMMLGVMRRRRPAGFLLCGSILALPFAPFLAEISSLDATQDGQGLWYWLTAMFVGAVGGRTYGEVSSE